MGYSLEERCVCRHWWERRRPRGRHDVDRKASDCLISLPLPSFPGPLDFDAYEFSLPPSYEDVVDIEKAIYPSTISKNFSGAVPLIQHPDQIIYHNYSIPSPSPDRSTQIFRYIRYRLFTVYNRLFTAVFLFNILFLLIILRQLHPQKNILSALATLASCNFLLAILVRQDYLVNLFFRCAWLVPWSSPLRVRCIAARVYCYGGLHSGAAVAGTLWWLAFTISMCKNYIVDRKYTFPLIATAFLISSFLVSIIMLAIPQLRQRYHDVFEISHRFMGWISIILFWTQIILLANYTSTSPPTRSILYILAHNPTSYVLTIMSCLLIYPWVRLRRWTFKAHLLSTHAIRLTFKTPVHRFSCLSISSSPLREWHPFATFPSTNPSAPGGSMVISSAGDWTRNVIREVEHKTALASLASNSKAEEAGLRRERGVEMTFYTKPHPKAGVLSLSLLFTRILILTTGSGIGPTLSSLLDRPKNQHARLVWSTRSPIATYGPDLLELVNDVDSHAMIIDTDASGRPDLLELAWGVYVREEMEAVFVLSNERVVRWVVGGLEGRGVPAFGPIWDS